MGQNNRNKVIVAWILAVILLGAGILRLYDLEEESLWLDECFTLNYASKPLNLLVETLKKDVHPIGYYLPQQQLLDYFGASEISLRILSVFFGILSVFLTYILGRKIFTWKEGLLAAFFMSISYTAILYSQEAKMYSMFAAFFLLSLFYFIKFMGKPSFLNTLFFSVSITLLLYTHIISLVILGGYIVFYLTGYLFSFKQSRNNKLLFFSSFFEKNTFSAKFSLALLLIFVFFLPWLKILTFYQLPLLYKSLGEKFVEKIGFNFLPSAVVLIILFSCGYVLFLYLVLTKNVHLKRFVDYYLKPIFTFLTKEKILFSLLFLFLVIDFILSEHFFSSVHIIRFGYFLLPIGYIFFSKILLRMKKNSLAAVIFILLVASASVELYIYYQVDSKEQFREAAEYMESRASPADVLFLHRAGITKQCFDYYYRGSMEEIRLVDPGNDDYLLMQRASGKENLYLLLSHNFHTKDYFKLQLDSLYPLTEEKKFIGITIYKYDVSES